MLLSYGTPQRCDSLGIHLFCRDVFSARYFDPKSNVSATPMATIACTVGGVPHHRGHSGYRTLKNEKLVPLASHHNERYAAALGSTRSCCRPQLCCRDPRRRAHIVLRLGNLVFDSTARKDGVPERLIACKSTNYFALPPFWRVGHFNGEGGFVPELGRNNLGCAPSRAFREGALPNCRHVSYTAVPPMPVAPNSHQARRPTSSKC